MCRQRQFVDELRFLFGFILKSLFIIILRFSVRIIVVLIVCIFVIRILIIENTKICFQIIKRQKDKKNSVYDCVCVKKEKKNKFVKKKIQSI